MSEANYSFLFLISKLNIMLALVVRHTGYMHFLPETGRSTGFYLMCSKPAKIKENKMDACSIHMIAQLALLAS